MTTTQPTIAHGIARFHPDQCLFGSQYSWGPEWALPPNRSGRWVIDLIYNAAIRVEFDDSLPDPDDDSFADARSSLDEARRALSAEEETRRNDWLSYADKREAEAFARKWNARKRREHGTLPQVAAGTYVRRGLSAGVWHLATGQVHDTYRNPDVLSVGTECHTDLTVDLGDADLKSVSETNDPGGNVCRRCLARTAMPEHASPLVEAVTA